MVYTMEWRTNGVQIAFKNGVQIDKINEVIKPNEIKYVIECNTFMAYFYK